MLLPCAVVEDKCDREKDGRRHSSSFVHVRRVMNERSPRRKCSGDSIDNVKSSIPGPKNNRVTFSCNISESSDLDSYSDSRSTTDLYGSGSSLCRKEKGSLKRRFKRMICRSLRRSQSAGCANDIPAHALFLGGSYMDRRHNTMESRSFQFSLLSQRLSESAVEDGKREIRKAHKTLSADVALMTASGTVVESLQSKSKTKKSSFQTVKRKFHNLRRRHTDTSLVPKFSLPRHIPSHAQVLQWSKSFGSLLDDKSGLEMFKGFLKSEFSEENLEFWIACEEYRFANQSSIPEIAHKIYAEFVAFQAPKEINLDSTTKMTTVKNLENPTKDTFLVAQHKIQALMEKDSYSRFIESELYQKLVENLSKS